MHTQQYLRSFSSLSLCGVQPMITSKLRIHDTCGVHNLHGMPAILSALFSALYAALANKDKYHNSLTDIFPAMSDANSTMAMEHKGTISGVSNCIFFYHFLPQLHFFLSRDSVDRQRINVCTSCWASESRLRWPSYRVF